MKLKKFLEHPAVCGVDIDDPLTVQLRRDMIQKRRFLRQIYNEWYASLLEALPAGDEPVLELGSGPSFLRDFLPEVITSDVFHCPGVDVVADGSQMPFSSGVFRGIVMTDVLHHLPKPRFFFSEAARCVFPGGRVVMIEPWVTAWSKLIYGRLHHEPFDTMSREWEFLPKGPLSGANSALPWIIFERDRAQFEREFPEWRIREINRIMPFRYLVSGGVSLRSLMPGWAFELWRLAEQALTPWMKTWAMFARVILVRVDIQGNL